MSMNSPLVSVVVPCYNHEKYVTRAIESIVNQTYKNIELFVIDDGSKDKSAEIVRSLSNKYNFYFEVQENKGIIPTINKLLSMCSGKYIAPFASDDVWLLDKIETQVKFMEANPDVGVCFGNMLSINGNNEILPYYFQRFSKFRIYEFDEILCFKANLPGPTVMFTKSALEMAGSYHPDYLIEDLYLWLKFAHSKYKVAVLPDLLGYYRIHQTNISKNNARMLKGKLQLLNLYRGEKGYGKGLFNAYFSYYLHGLMGIIPKKIFPFGRN